MQSNISAQWTPTIFFSKDKKFIIGPNFGLPLKHVKFWFPHATQPNKTVFVLRNTESLKKLTHLTPLLNSDGLIIVDGAIPAHITEENEAVEQHTSKNSGDITDMIMLTVKLSLIGVTTLFCCLIVVDTVNYCFGWGDWDPNIPICFPDYEVY